MTLAVERMGQRLTLPFARGADTLVLALAPGAGPAEALVAPYDFAEHHARFDATPDPRYAVTVVEDLAAPVSVIADHAAGSSAPLRFGAGTRAGQSGVLALPAAGPPGPTLTRLRVAGLPPGRTAATVLRVTALLGNTAKLLWALGWERDNVRRELDRVAAQRQRAAGEGRALELLGYDLGVPRFVPLPYAYDADTVLLLHLDDVPPAGQAEAAVAADARVLHVGAAAAHDGLNAGAASRAPGRFGGAFRFGAPTASVRVGDHADFALPATASLTAECFVKPDAAAPEGQLLSKHPDPRVAAPGPAGWALTLGAFGRGLEANVRLLLCDGSLRLELFADDALAPGGFHHVAGVLDRAAGEARLYVDGVVRARRPLGALGSLTNGEPVRLGAGAAPGFLGSLDEVRISRVARAGFAPVVGESDASYRRRLAIFQRWTLPTPANVQAALNEAVGAVDGIADPLVVDDRASTIIAGATTVALRPAALPQGAHVDALGRRRPAEPDVSGRAGDEADTFRPFFLTHHDDPRAAYAPAPPRDLAPGEAAPDPHAMQASAARALDDLLDLVGGGLTTVRAAFDPRADDLRAVGRGLLLTHSSLSNARLAALAHAAGFAWVENRHRDAAVYVSVTLDEYLTITGGAGGPLGDLEVGQTATLAAAPSLPGGARWEWLLVPCGAGRAHLTGRPTGPAAELVGDAPGTLTVRVEARGPDWSASGTRSLRIAPQAIADGRWVDAAGAAGAGVPDPPREELDPFHPVYLLTSDRPVDYGSTDARRMQAEAEAALGRLAELAEAEAPAGTLRVAGAWVRSTADLLGPGREATPGLDVRGRELTLTHSTLDPGRLGALAWGAGFAQVWRAGAEVHARSAQGDLLRLTVPAALEEGTSAAIDLAPRAAPQAPAAASGTVVTANTGSDSVSRIDGATGRVTLAVKVGRAPSAVAVTPDGQAAFTADRLSNTVSAVDLSTGGVTGTVAVPDGPAALALRDKRLLVVCRDAARLVLLDAPTLGVVADVPCRAQISSMAVAADASTIWLTAFGDQVVQVFSLGPPPVLQADVTVPGLPSGVALLDAADQAFVTLQDTGRVQVVKVSATAVAGDFATGPTPVGVATATIGGALRVLVLDATAGREELRSHTPTGQERGTARLPDGSTGVAVDGSQAHVTGRGRDHLCTIDLSDPSALRIRRIRGLGSGLGESFTWVTRALGEAEARLTSPTSPATELAAGRAGPVAVRAVLSLDDHQDPYAFEVRLRPELASPGTTISRDQYDLLMNVLNLLHPVGVEVRTAAVREHVPEVSTGDAEAFPAYTYPDFRVRGPAPTRPQRSDA